MKMFIALLLYQGLVCTNQNSHYWATRSLYHGLWAWSFTSRNHYQALLGMLHESDPLTEDTHAKLKKVDEKSCEMVENLVLPYYWHSCCEWFYLISATS